MMDAIFTSNCLCELILDGTHIKDAMLEWLMPLLGSKRILAVSGSGRYAGWKYPNGLTLHDHEVLKDNAYIKMEFYMKYDRYARCIPLSL